MRNLFGIGLLKGVVDVIEWRPDPNRNQLVWHYPKNNLTTYSQLIVNETQEAFIYKDGQAIGKFGPGRHTLDTKNLPILSSLYGIPFGGKNPFIAEIWFVNKLDFNGVEFTSDMFRYHDPDYKSMIPLVAKIRCGYKVSDCMRLLKRVVGTRESLDADDLYSFLSGDISTCVVSMVSARMQADRIGIKSVPGYFGILSECMRGDLHKVFDAFGLALRGLNVVSVDVDASRPDGRAIQEAMTKQSAQSIAGYTWQQEKAFDIAGQQVQVAEKALTSNTQLGTLGAMMIAAGGGSFLGGGIASTVAGAMSPVASSAQAGSTTSGQVQNAGAVRMVFCSKCARKYPSTAKFCPYCGDVYNACPKCGYDNDERALRCVNCGTPLVDGGGGNCPKCGAPISKDAAFCPSCGEPLQRNCSRCGAALKADSQFCPACGKKVL